MPRCAARVGLLIETWGYVPSEKSRFLSVGGSPER